MDAIYRTQRHIYDLTRKYYLLGRDALIDGLAPPAGGSVLEIGCGTGRNLICAARRWPDARFYGIDISEAMLETARANVAKAGLVRPDHLCAGRRDRVSMPGAVRRHGFDRVFQSYTLSMIPDWHGALREGVGEARARRSARHRRFRPAGALAALVRGAAVRVARQVRRHPARRSVRGRLTKSPRAPSTRRSIVAMPGARASP